MKIEKFSLSKKVIKARETKNVSRLQLARETGINPVTLLRIEKGYDCQIGTAYKLIRWITIVSKDNIQKRSTNARNN